MATKINDNLYVGDALDAELVQFENPLAITAVVNVALVADTPVDGITNIQVPMEDGWIPAAAFDRALRAIGDHIQSGGCWFIV